MSRLSEEKSKISNEPKIYNYYNKPEQVEEVKYVGAYFRRNQPTVQKKQEHSMFYQSEPRKPVNMQAEFQKLKVETDDYEFDPKISSLSDEEHIDETSFYDDCEFEPKISSLSDEEHIDIVHNINLTEQKVIDTVENYILQSVEENDCNTYAETAKTVKNCLVEVGLIPQSASLNSIMAAEEVHYQNMSQVVDLLKEALKAAQAENEPPRTPPGRKPKPKSPKAPKRPKRKSMKQAKEAVEKSNSNGKKKQRVMAGKNVAINDKKAKSAMKKPRKPLKRNATSAGVEKTEKAKKQKMRKEMQDKVHKKAKEARKKADEAKKKAEDAKKKAEELEKKAKEAEAAHDSAHKKHAKKLFEMLGREGIEEAKLTLASELVDEDGKSTMSDIQFASICLENGIGVDE